jgi:hypothetical protein
MKNKMKPLTQLRPFHEGGSCGGGNVHFEFDCTGRGLADAAGIKRPISANSKMRKVTNQFFKIEY